MEKKHTKKKKLFFALVLTAALVVAGGCAARNGGAIEEGKVNVVTSFFPLYDFARTIGGDRVNAINMVPVGVEPHDWTPKSQDMANISKAQVFAYQGAGFEGWTDDVLGSIDTEGLVIIEASRGISLIEAAESLDEVREAQGEGPAEEGAPERGNYDPHTWLSPRSALQMASNLLEGLKEADPAYAEDYERNYAALEQRLIAIDQAYDKQLSAAPNKEMVVAHQAFGYLARDYGLTQMPILGLTAEGEPTAQDLKEISEFVKERDVSYIFTEELLSDELAKTLANDLGVETLPLHPLEGLTEAEQEAGETYVSLMEKNLGQLVKAFQ